MTSITMEVRLQDFPATYRKLGKKLPEAVMRGAVRGAMRAVSTLQRATSTASPADPGGKGQSGAVNTGAYKRAWKWEKLDMAVRVYNASPYAGIIEHGRRPGRFPPLSVIEHWAQRKLGLSKKEAKAAAFPIARAIAKRGLAGRKVLTKAAPKLEQDFIAEIRAELDRTVLTGGGAP